MKKDILAFLYVIRGEGHRSRLGRPGGGGRNLVAWDGTREAVRAVNDALPLLGDAEVVIVTFVGAQETSLEQHRPSLERIVDHLLRHGIPAKPEETLHGGIAISDMC